MNERMKILKLLEEGKITAEEAERLLEAVGESEFRRRRGFFFGLESLSDIMSDMMGSIFINSYKTSTTTERIEVGKKKKVIFKVVSGDAEINGKDISEFVINKNGIIKVIDEDEMLLIKAVSGNLEIDTPKKIDLEIKGVSGNLVINGIEGNIEIATVSGDITGKGLKGSFYGKFVSGDVELEYEKVDGIQIESKSGDVILKIDENIEAEIEISSRYGDIDCELPLRDVTKQRNYLRGILNSPKSKIVIRNSYGDVSVERR